MPANQVVVTVREDDDITHAGLEQLGREGSLPAGFQKVTVGSVPLTASMNAGLASTTGDLVAMTDDDAEPRADWLERCVAVLRGNPAVGGVGGRDWQPHDHRSAKAVGLVSWYGRGVGNHHLGVGPPRDVDLLKGVNAVFRGDLLRRVGFDRRLRGRGNVTHWELSLCLTLRRQGWRLVYDPSIAVDHRPAARHDGDVNSRGGFDAGSFADSVHNDTVAVMDHLPAWGRAAFLVWAVLIGTSSGPGLAQLARLAVRSKRAHPLGRWRATLAGRVAGVRTVMSQRNAS